MRLSLAIVFISLATFSYGQRDTLLLVNNSTIYFDNASSEIREDQIATVDSLLKSIKETDHVRIKIQAHTDQVGNPEYNEALSKDRATSIATYLTAQGVQADIIESDHFGEEQLMTSNQNPDSLQQNRRAQVSVYSSKPRLWLSGKVMNILTDSPLVAKVYFHSKFWSDGVQTDSLGNFKIRVPKDEVISINATSPRHLASQEMGKMTERFVKELKIIKLTLGDGQWIAGQILSDSGAHVSNAKVQMHSKLWSDNARTDSTGDFKLFVPKQGLISIDIVAKDYLIEMTSLKVTPQLKKQPLAFKLAPLSDGKKFKLQRIFFVGNQDFLLERSFNVLPQLLSFMKTNQNTCIRIEGHINMPNEPNIETTTTSYYLSVARARRIYNYLMSKDVSKNRMVYKGYGNWKMIHPTSTLEEEMAENRRVEIAIIDCAEVAEMENDKISEDAFLFNFIPQFYDTYIFID